MPSPAPVTLDPAAFDPANVPEATRAFDRNLRAQCAKDTTKWWHIGAPEYRRLRKTGGTSRPAPTYLDSATSFTVPSREAGRTIPCRLLRPQNGKPVRGVFMHIHGGGFVLSDEMAQDQRLQDTADEHGLVCVSVGYRLAPENPFPAGPEDCYDAAEWLILHAQDKYGPPLRFIGGESAGAHLSLVTALHLLQHADPRFADFRLAGLVLHYGCFTFNLAPSARHMDTHQPNLLLTLEDIHHFRDAFLGPDWTQETLVRPDVSPLYADLEALRGRLPAALFTCGTMDCLIDDTLFMSARWVAAGGEAVVEIVPGAQHAYSTVPAHVEGSGAARGLAAFDKFVGERI
ncbi:Acetyl esterase-like protein [Hapsidospora chrysogenum ATCC 11550]|uniref:Acetyl esterase-like protein n=1 Tax=Hapsidospora chrysogenum (strain ATCC 11550 / CBS 779.69 / DSM 880 / IAM 14645 / JCM 23072 / IMI 49137) TaxID=857340 RepID=A0A086T9P2_HAPC1|nr:Acetyl esterase-like protein [Hapsidospora chrysogenum ATCC 11550]